MTRSTKTTRPPTAYVPLRVRSYYSLLTGASSPADYLSTARSLGLPALALTDTNNLYGAGEFFAVARGHDAPRPLLGSLITTSCHDVLLLVANDAGYSNLCRIISARHLDPSFSLFESVIAHQEGLAVLVSDLDAALALHARIDRGRLWVEVVRPSADPSRERTVLRRARRLGLPLVASANIYSAVLPHARRYAMLEAIRRNCRLSTAAAAVGEQPRVSLPSAAEFASLFADLPEAVRATQRLASQCEFALRPRAPVFPPQTERVVRRLFTEAEAALPILTQLIFFVFGMERMIPLLIRQGGILFFGLIFGLIEVVCVIIAIIKLTEYLKNNSEKASV